MLMITFKEWIFTGMGLSIAICGFTGIAMTFYLGRTKMKEVDRLFYGFEVPSDSIFHQLPRLSRYGGAFSSHWVAKRTKLLYLRDHFDQNFQRPFIIAHRLMLTAGIGMVLLFVLDILYLKVGTY